VTRPVQDEADFGQGLRQRTAPHHLGQQVTEGDVDEAGGRHHQRVGQQRAGRIEHEVAHHAAQHGRGARDQLKHEGLALREAGIQQDHEVADLVRDFVCHDGEGGQHARLPVEQEGGRDDHAVGKVVEGIADQDRPAATTGFAGIVAGVVVMGIALVVVRVMDQRRLFQQEQAEDRHQQHPAEHERIGLTVEGLGQQVRQRDRQQHAGGHTHQLVDQTRQGAEAQQGCQTDRHQRGQQVGQDDQRQRGHGGVQAAGGQRARPAYPAGRPHTGHKCN